ncbi:acyl-CoA dehydrogenase family protein [Halomarina halobia]|uniref:Acyl-CoA dehydrogenase family protein n=1 Tax=Halomarina halobia TaxID=3033386 RepID=A0ABD6ACR3_9EURY|nr:acyl-CoA dehydrogenase [Halomarina sp. PSR21]
MDATLTDEQERIRKTAREFIESEGGIELARRRMDGDASVVDDLWSDLADLDYTAITVPPEYDGFGEGMVYLTALLEVTGRYALPGPLPETAAFAVPLLDELGTGDQRERHLTAVAEGDRTLSFALYDDRNESLPGAVDLDVDRTDDGYRLSGTKTLVPYGGEVDHLIVAGRSRDGPGHDGISLFVVGTDEEAVETNQLDSLDRTRPMYEVTFSDLTVGEEALLGDLHEAGDALSAAADRYTVASCAMLVGAADRAVELSTEHGNEREQYGQPVGKFQAVKHRIADMWIEMQSARSLVYYAAWALEAGEPDATRSVSALKAYAADRLHRVFGDDMWNHGGMGFTWDYDGHIYLKQAKAWRNFLGSPEYHQDRLIEERLAER